MKGFDQYQSIRNTKSERIVASIWWIHKYICVVKFSPDQPILIQYHRFTQQSRPKIARVALATPKARMQVESPAAVSCASRRFPV